MSFHFKFFSPAKNDMSFIHPNPRDRERTCIKEKVKSRSKYTCSEIPYAKFHKVGRYAQLRCKPITTSLVVTTDTTNVAVTGYFC